MNVDRPGPPPGPHDPPPQVRAAAAAVEVMTNEQPVEDADDERFAVTLPVGRVQARLLIRAVGSKV